jgi:hypothetical protein
MKTKRIQAILAVTALVFLLVNMASAGDRFQRRQNNQKHRINHGVRNGLNHLQDRASGSIYRDRHNGYNRDRHYQHNRQRYSGPAYGYGYTPHRYYRPLSGYTFYSVWASPGWAFGFSTHGR